MDFPRDTPLAVCPNLGCRRSGQCMGEARGQNCERFYIDEDEWRYALAEKLERNFIARGGNPADLLSGASEPSPEVYNALRKIVAKLDAEECSVNVLARKRPMR
ncbi:MAG: hypothetical protein ACREDX_06085 [Aestuariivirga sp.]